MAARTLPADHGELWRAVAVGAGGRADPRRADRGGGSDLRPRPSPLRGTRCLGLLQGAVAVERPPDPKDVAGHAQVGPGQLLVAAEAVANGVRMDELTLGGGLDSHPAG